MTTNNKLGETVGSAGRSIYLNRDEASVREQRDRYVVTFAAAYGPGDEINSPEQALAAAFMLVAGEGHEETVWFVYDRLTGEHHTFDMGEVLHLVPNQEG